MVARPKTAVDEVFIVRVELDEVDPLVWRALAVRSSMNLAGFHDVLQDAMGWTNSHLHEYVVGDERIGVPDPDDRTSLRDERRVRLRDVLRKPRDQMFYDYDFGDNWRHIVRLESVIRATRGERYPILLAGECACPPEDVGGPPGYEDFLKAIKDPAHEDHESMLEWIGGPSVPTNLRQPSPSGLP